MQKNRNNNFSGGGPVEKRAQRVSFNFRLIYVEYARAIQLIFRRFWNIYCTKGDSKPLKMRTRFKSKEKK